MDKEEVDLLRGVDCLVGRLSPTCDHTVLPLDVGQVTGLFIKRYST